MKYKLLILDQNIMFPTNIFNKNRYYFVPDYYETFPCYCRNFYIENDTINIKEKK